MSAHVYFSVRPKQKFSSLTTQFQNKVLYMTERHTECQTFVRKHPTRHTARDTESRFCHLSMQKLVTFVHCNCAYPTPTKYIKDYFHFLVKYVFASFFTLIIHTNYVHTCVVHRHIRKGTKSGF